MATAPLLPTVHKTLPQEKASIPKARRLGGRATTTITTVLPTLELEPQQELERARIALLMRLCPPSSFSIQVPPLEPVNSRELVLLPVPVPMVFSNYSMVC